MAIGDGLSRPRATLVRVKGDDWAAVSAAAPTHDAILFARQMTDTDRPLATPELMKDALEYAGRPIVVLTGKVRRSVVRHVGIAWNGSVESARAVSAALPILASAAQVTIFTFATTKTDVAEAEHLSSYLSRHEVKSDLDTREPDRTIGETLVATAEEKGVTLLVAGGYTHGQLRQAILGGVTRHLLKRCAVPLLMAH